MSEHGERGTDGTGSMRARLAAERGFTMIELLVVTIIIGLLSAVALPAFLGQQAKAVDASAKELAHTVQVTAETYATDNGGIWTGMTPAALAGIEATIPTSSPSVAYLSAVTNADASGYTLTISDLHSNETFSISRRNGVITRTCTPATGLSGGCVDGTW